MQWRRTVSDEDTPDTPTTFEAQFMDSLDQAKLYLDPETSPLVVLNDCEDFVSSMLSLADAIGIERLTLKILARTGDPAIAVRVATAQGLANAVLIGFMAGRIFEASGHSLPSKV